MVNNSTSLKLILFCFHASIGAVLQQQLLLGLEADSGLCLLTAVAHMVSGSGACVGSYSKKI